MYCKYEKKNTEERSAFLEYSECIIKSIVSTATLLKKGDVIHINRFQLRRLFTDTHASIQLSKPNNEFSLSKEEIIATHLEKLLKITVPECEYQTINKAVWHAKLTDLSLTANWKIVSQLDNDYKFSYSLPTFVKPLNLTEYCARTLEFLLDVIVFLSGDSLVFPDEIVIGNDRAEIRQPSPYEPYNLGARNDGKGGTGKRQPLYSVISTEPSIVALARQWGLLSSFIQIEANNKYQNIDGFQLKQNSDWIVSSECHPSEVYEYLARVCNVSCKFCYLYGNPSNMAVARGTSVISQNEIETRLRYFNPTKNQALFHAQWEINEFLVDPKLPKVLRQLRQQTTKPFFFITNGSPLTPNVIDLLADLKPVHLIVSTNSLDAPLRSSIMREKEAQTMTALSCLQNLIEKEIPFGISLVAFPELSLQRLEETVYKLDSLRPAFIRINLPGFTREHPYPFDFDTEKYWGRVVNWVQSMRKKVSVPLLTIPSAFEENFFYDDPNSARIVGVIPNSPAAVSGLKSGDIVKRAGFFDIETRAQLQSILLLSRNSIELEVDRNGSKFLCTIDSNSPIVFPYNGHVIGKYIFPFGVVLSPCLSTGDANAIKEAFESPNISNGWLITSELMLPAAKALLLKELPELNENIQYVIAKNDFLGGNIRVLDMCTVGDIARAIDLKLQNSFPPDVIMLPSTGFNLQGRDLAGRHWGDLERWFGIPVWLLSSTSQFVF